MLTDKQKLNKLSAIISSNEREMDRIFRCYKSGSISVVAYFNQCNYVNSCMLTAVRKLVF